MVCLGSKSFRRKVPGRCNLSENCEYFDLDAAARQYSTRRMKKDFGKRKGNTSRPKSPSCAVNQTRGKSDDPSIHDGRNPNEKTFKHGKGNHGLTNDSVCLGNQTFSKDRKHTSQKIVLRYVFIFYEHYIVFICLYFVVGVGGESEDSFQIHCIR